MRTQIEFTTSVYMSILARTQTIHALSTLNNVPIDLYGMTFSMAYVQRNWKGKNLLWLSARQQKANNHLWTFVKRV